MLWVRVDNRLIHGQIIETWLPFTKSRMIVVANDELHGDILRQQIMGLAIPNHIEKVFLPVAEVHSFLDQCAKSGDDPEVLVLFSSCEDARRAYEEGLAFTQLNLGNMHYAPGKEQVCAHVAVNGEDKLCLRYFVQHGVKLDFRCVPNEPVQVESSW